MLDKSRRHEMIIVCDSRVAAEHAQEADSAVPAVEPEGARARDELPVQPLDALHQRPHGGTPTRYVSTRTLLRAHCAPATRLLHTLHAPCRSRAGRHRGQARPEELPVPRRRRPAALTSHSSLLCPLWYVTTVTSKNCASQDSELYFSSQALCRLVHSRPGHLFICRAVHLYSFYNTTYTQSMCTILYCIHLLVQYKFTIVQYSIFPVLYYSGPITRCTDYVPYDFDFH